MGTLDAMHRNALPDADFAGPNRTYPIEDKAHAVDALARASTNAGPELKTRIDNAVYHKYPDLKPKSSD
jgi:hypothetical protein